jgi:hypothetical protein
MKRKQKESVSFNIIPNVFNKVSTVKKINDYILVGKIKNITFPENTKKSATRYSKILKDEDNDDAPDTPMVKVLLEKAKNSKKMHSKQLKDSDDCDSSYLDPSAIDKQQINLFENIKHK